MAIKLGDSYGKEKRGYLASSRIRGHWLSKYWPECDDFFYPEEFNQKSEEFFQPENQLKILRDYDAVILNKTYEWRLAKLLHDNRQIVIVDFCDPDFLSSHSSKQRVSDCKETLKYTDLAVVNGPEMEYKLKRIYKGPIHIIPDRIDLETCRPVKKEHKEKLKSVVWYGYSENLRVLEPYLKDIIDMGIETTIISDKFFENLILTNCINPPKEMITFKVWHPETINKQIVSHDVVFTGKDKDEYLSSFKSNNRMMTAYALGMPVARDIQELTELLPKVNRIQNAKNGNRLCREKYDIRHSVWAYDHLIRRIINARLNGM